MTPAYDISFAYKPNHEWIGTHQMTLNGKSSEIKMTDLMEFGNNIGLSKSFCKTSVNEIIGTVEKWMSFAAQCGITEERATEIGNMLNQTGLVKIQGI